MKPTNAPPGFSQDPRHSMAPNVLNDGPRSSGPRLLAVGGGKGGVGKTFVTANLATSLAKLGQRVVVVDMDLEGANLHTCLGVPSPQRSLADFVSEREEDLGKLLVDTPLPNLKLIGATHGNLADAQPSHLRRVRLLRGLRQLDADLVLLDLGAGSHASVLDYFLVSDDGILVLQPEPTSVENAYTFLRAAFYRRMRLAMVGHGVRQLVTMAMDQRNERGIRTPLDLLREIEATDTAEAHRFVETMRVFKPRIIVNGVRTAEDVKLGFAVGSVCKKYFGIEAEYLGYVNYDDQARRSVSMRRPIVDMQKDSDVSIYLQRIAHKLLGLPSAAATQQAAGRTAAAQQHHQEGARPQAQAQAPQPRPSYVPPGTPGAGAATHAPTYAPTHVSRHETRHETRETGDTGSHESRPYSSSPGVPR